MGGSNEMSIAGRKLYATEMERLSYFAQKADEKLSKFSEVEQEYLMTIQQWEHEYKELEKELNMYRNALTQSVARPMGVLPDCEQWYCVNLNGNIVVKSK